MVDNAVLTSSYMMELLFSHFAFKKKKKKVKLHRKKKNHRVLLKFHFKYLEVLKLTKHSELCNHDCISLPYLINLLSDTIFNCRHTG